MPTLLAPKPSKSSVNNELNPHPIPLFRLGSLFVLRVSYWSCKAGNEPAELNLSPDRIQAKAIASFGTKDLIDPEKGRRIFQFIEKKARHELEKVSRPFPAAGAHFVPRKHISKLVEALEELRLEFDAAVDAFVAQYSDLQAAWRQQHPQVPASAYPAVTDLRRRFSFGWNTFKITPPGPVKGVDGELVQTDQLALMEAELQDQCQQFVAEYVMAFRKEVAAFCDQVVTEKGQVHGKTLAAIRRRIDRFHAMNVFGDGDAAQRLEQLRSQIKGLTGESLVEQPDVAAALSQACTALKAAILDPQAVSSLTGRLKRRVILD